MAFIIADEILARLLGFIRHEHVLLGNFKGLYLNGFYIGNAWQNLKAP